VSVALEVEDLVVSFPGQGERTPVVDGLGLRLAVGETLALVGESGCGKSISALACLRLVPRPGRIERGRIAVGGREILDLSVPEMRGLRGSEISMIFQEPMTSLNPVTNVGDQVIEAILLHERVGRSAARARTLDLFDPDARARLDAYPHQLSGGLKQRVMIAMALATVPRVLIADEPTTALDVTIQAQILQLLRDLQRDSDTAILLITHDLGIVNELSDRVAVMYAGRKVEEGGRVDVLARSRHPYTEGLLRSIPALAQPGERLAEIPGVVPPPDEWPPGCRFTGRCPRALTRCPDEPPTSTPLPDEHRVWCHAVAEDVAS
jgi:oligopeptide/dipeptide ABC transporter ATP-binding protein